MKIFDADDYRQLVQHFVYSGESAWGGVKKLAKALVCHPSYIPQVAKGKAHFSNEQALRFALYYEIGSDETEFFVDLVNRDKAGDKSTREFFQKRLDGRRLERLSLEKRWKISQALNPAEEAIYYSSWVPQALHMYAQLPGKHTCETLSRRLGIEKKATEHFLQNLEKLGLLESEDGRFKCIQESVHLSKNSPVATRNHINWRLKTVSDLMLQPSPDSMHYSSAVSMSRKDAARLHDLILDHLEKVRELIIPSPSEEVFIHCIDFCPPTARE